MLQPQRHNGFSSAADRLGPGPKPSTAVLAPRVGPGPKRWIAVLAILLAATLGAQPHPQRIVSLVPAATEILFAIGAGPQVVAVSSYDTFPPEVERLPRVGALLDPDLERILSLRPDLVVIYGSQHDLQQQFERSGVPIFRLVHGGLAEIESTMRELGARTGHRDEAQRASDQLRARIDAVRARVTGRPRPRTLLVFGRAPGSLRNLYASGGYGFLHDMLVAAGGENVFADIHRESVQASTEMILARRPEVILELHAEPPPSADLDAWQAVSSVPAVANGRIHVLTGTDLVVPGPRVAGAVERMAQVLHPE